MRTSEMKINLCFKGILIVGMILISFCSYAQTYALPDTSLRNKLIADYPSVMTGNLLNITAAGNLTGTLNLSNAGIKNAEGIQYFTKINILHLGYNQLRELPNISGLTQLFGIYLMNNQLVSIPSLSTMTNLIDFQAPSNRISSLPSLAANTNLINIYCQNNKLTSLPDISMLTNLQVLDIGNNNFRKLPDLSPLVNLKQLHVHQTGIDTIPGLSALSNLTVLYAWENKIRDLSGLDSNTKLVVFQVFDNELKSLPILSNKPSLATVTFNKNHLTFEDILPLTSLPTFNIFDYSPQKNIPLPSQIVREKDIVTFNTSIDAGVPDNQYTWYKNGTILATNQTGIFSISSAAFNDSGSYYVQVTNPGLTGLTLQTNKAKLTIHSCLEINGFETEVLSENCKDGTSIELTAIQLAGGIAPYSYAVHKSTKTDTLFGTSPKFQSLLPGFYTLIIKDSRMCQASRIISVKTPSDCQSIISPNGDGIMDTYFIDEPGIIKIFDISRNLINQFNTPYEWDGRKSDGSIAEDGYYAIVINEKKVIHITVVK